MGNAEWKSEEVKLDNPLFNNLRLEESKENTFHFHWKDIRLEMAKDSFYALYRAMRSAYSYVKGISIEDTPLCVTPFICNPIDEGTVKLERVSGGNYHLHYRDMRIELTKDDLHKIRTVLGSE